MTKKPLIIAHRGASSLAHENTLEAFNNAIKIGADYIELDVRKTSDGVIIVYHGPDEQRNERYDLNFKELCEETGANIPKLEEILRLAQGKIRLDVEIKEAGYEREVVDLVLKYFSIDEFVVTSMIDESLVLVKKSYPSVRTGLILGVYKPKNVLKTRFSEFFPERRAIRAQTDFIVPHYQLLKFGFLRRMRKNHLPVFVWVVNNREMIRSFILKQTIAAIITDSPDIALKIRIENDLSV